MKPNKQNFIYVIKMISAIILMMFFTIIVMKIMTHEPWM